MMDEEEDTQFGRVSLFSRKMEFQKSDLFPNQIFELIRTLTPDNDKKDGSVLPPNDGTFRGLFTFMYYHTTSFTNNSNN